MSYSTLLAQDFKLFTEYLQSIKITEVAHFLEFFSLQYIEVIFGLIVCVILQFSKHTGGLVMSYFLALIIFCIWDAYFPYLTLPNNLIHGNKAINEEYGVTSRPNSLDDINNLLIPRRTLSVSSIYRYNNSSGEMMPTRVSASPSHGQNGVPLPTRVSRENGAGVINSDYMRDLASPSDKRSRSENGSLSELQEPKRLSNAPILGQYGGLTPARLSLEYRDGLINNEKRKSGANDSLTERQSRNSDDSEYSIHKAPAAYKENFRPVTEEEVITMFAQLENTQGRRGSSILYPHSIEVPTVNDDQEEQLSFDDSDEILVKKTDAMPNPDQDSELTQESAERFQEKNNKPMDKKRLNSEPKSLAGSVIPANTISSYRFSKRSEVISKHSSRTVLSRRNNDGRSIRNSIVSPSSSPRRLAKENRTSTPGRKSIRDSRSIQTSQRRSTNLWDMDQTEQPAPTENKKKSYITPKAFRESIEIRQKRFWR